jgi:zeta-carotene desaturase
VPAFALINILENSNIPELNSLAENMMHFEYNPIMTINIFLDKPLHGQFPAALIASPVQWIFQHPDINKSGQNFGYALVSSAANDYSEFSREEMLQLVKAELNRAFNIELQKTHHIVNYKVISEKRATISQTPESLHYRPATKTPIKNFFLAGDWIDTGLPATIEGAALSGKLAIEQIALNRSD